MTLPQKAIDEYKKIFFEDYGVELTNLEATEQATRLINLFRVLMKPSPERPNPQKSR